MTPESATINSDQPSELPYVKAEICLNCGIETIAFKVDKEGGYYKLCLTCGYTEYLHRRFLRFNRQSRRWE